MRKLIALLASIMLLTACGFKGPLYLPGSKSGHKSPQATDASAPAKVTPKPSSSDRQLDIAP